MLTDEKCYVRCEYVTNAHMCLIILIKSFKIIVYTF